jgi:butyryl-CoA dehydrogenase
MESAVVNRRDLEFLLFEVLGVEALCTRARYRDHDRKSLEAALDLTIKIADEVLWRNAPKSDVDEPALVDGQVRVSREVHQGVAAMRDAGFVSAGLDYARGGMQLPAVAAQACLGVLKAADPATVGYLMLTKAAANLLDAHGSEAQKRLYMAPLYEGRYFGTMCLSEPDVGSSLADIRSRAVPAGDGTYRLRGNKMWISGGDQDISENIIHLVLAKLPDAPPGVKGISLFIVPKIRVNPDGTLGRPNDVAVAGLNHKMGFRAISNCLLNFGENNACEAHMVGPPHGGLACMFQMMNEARIGVGIGATMLGYAGYMQSLRYAKERRQGRRVDNKDPSSSPVPIIEHADVKRMLLKQKAFAEGGLLLCLTCARLLDEMATAPEAAAREHAALLLDILTPIAKAWPAEYCLEANKLAIQVHGGYGYTRDFPVERLYRDNRLNAIHEGTNGIQALDLLGRKVRLDEGRAFAALLAEIRAEASYADREPSLAEYTAALREMCVAIEAATAAIAAKRANHRISESLANATLYLHALGQIVIAWLWLRQTRVATAALSRGAADDDSAFYRGKLAACRYFYRYELAQMGPMIDLLTRVDTTCLTTEAEMF